MTTVNVRYMIDDVDAAVAIYTTRLGFTLNSKAGAAFELSVKPRRVV